MIFCLMLHNLMLLNVSEIEGTHKYQCIQLHDIYIHGLDTAQEDRD